MSEFRRGWAIVATATIGAGTGISALPFFTLGSFVAPLQEEFGWGRRDIAAALLYLTVTLAVVAPWLGIVADRVGVRRVLLVSVPLLSGAFALIGSRTDSLTTFYLLFGLTALVGGGANPVIYSRAVSVAFVRSRGLALGISLSGIAVAAMLLPSLLAVINARYGWRTGYLTLSLLALLPWTFVLFAVPAVPATARQTGDSFAALRSLTGLFWFVAAVFCTVAFAVSAMILHLIPLLRDVGLDPAEAARVASSVGIGMLIGRIGTGFLSDRFFAAYVGAALFLSTAIGCLCLALGGASLAPLAALTTGLSLGAEVDLMAFLTARYFGLRHYAFQFGVMYSLFCLAASIGPTLAGASFDSSGSYVQTLWGVILLMCVAAGMALRLPRYERTVHGGLT